MANLIRVKQLDQPDLSGFFNSAFIQTGIVSKQYVDRFSDQTVSGLKTFENGVNLDSIDNLSLSGVDITITSGIVTLTNAPILSGNPLITGNLSLYATTINLASTGSTLVSSINSLNSNFTGFTGNLDATYASDIQLNNTGVNLVNSINSLSGSVVLKYNDQTITGIKTFTNSGVFSLSGAIPLGLPNNPLSVVGSGNNYVQINIQNRATGTTATADLVITANNGTDTTNYINLGINNSGYNDSAFSNGSGLDGYLFVNGGSLDIGTQTPNTQIEFHAEGTTADKVIARINRSGLSIITGNIYISGNPVLTGNTNLYGTTANLETTGSTLVKSINSLSGSSVLIIGNQLISGVKTFFDSGIFSNGGVSAVALLNNPLSIVGSGTGYVQVNIQNRGTGFNASADLVITANNGTDNSNFINLGINNVGYNDPAFTNGTGLDGYLFIDGGNLDIGTRTPGRAIEFHAGGTTAASTVVRINSVGLLMVSGYVLNTINTGVVAGTNAQNQGPLTNQVNIITTNPNNPGGVTLPTAISGFSSRIMVRNTAANPVNVYPASGARIDASGINFSGAYLIQNAQKEFYSVGTGQWYSI